MSYGTVINISMAYIYNDVGTTSLKGGKIVLLLLYYPVRVKSCY